jgi:glucose-1-phosphate thymidylyltransferase
MSAGIREILLITTAKDQSRFVELLGSGENLGIRLEYAVQDSPGGIAEAFLIGQEFISGSNCALILGDNVFHGSGLGRQLMNNRSISGAKIFAYQVSNPEAYGVVEFSGDGSAISIEEKPVLPKSNFAVPGLYFFDEKVNSLAVKVQPSARGEKEIVDILRSYLSANQLVVEILPRGTAWLDTGTFSGLNDASNFVRILEERQGQRIACLEEIAWRQKWISTEELREISKRSFHDNDYLNSLLVAETTRDW